MKVLVLFYSTWGHIYRMMEATAEGAKEVPGADVIMRRVPETASYELLKQIGAADAQKAFDHVPIVTLDEMAAADAFIFGTPTRYGNMIGQMRTFLDSLGALWAKDTFVGKVSSVISSSGTQHGGQESTILTFIPTLLHLGMIYVGLPYSFGGQRRMDEITGGSPYGASTIAGAHGERWPSENELAAALYQGKHVASIAAKLFG